jgi:hypothetical protein
LPQQRGRPGHGHPKRPPVSEIESVDVTNLRVDKSSFDTLRSSGDPVAVAREASAATPGSGQGVGHKKVDLDAVGRLPFARVPLEFEVRGFEKITDARSFCEELGGDRQVSVGGELSDSQVGWAGV